MLRLAGASRGQLHLIRCVDCQSLSARLRNTALAASNSVTDSCCTFVTPMPVLDLTSSSLCTENSKRAETPEHETTPPLLG